MPSLVTHYIFGKQVEKNIDKKYIDKNIYSLFNQSHDYLFFSSKKEFKELAKKGHHKNTKDFIINIIKYIKDNHLEEDKPTISYLYGIINHYVLDSTCHPYIFYLSGSYHKEEKDTKKYNGMHSKIEKSLDKIIYEKYYNKKFNKLNLGKDIMCKEDLSSLKGIIDSVYYETYKVNNTYKEYHKCYKKMRSFNRFIVIDRLGIKNRLYSLVDLITCNHFGVLSCYSTSLKVNKDIMNYNHNIWKHPVTGKENDTSFMDLFNDSINKSVNIINKVNEVLYNNKPIKSLDSVIKNIDYSTGLEIKDNKRMIYFSF